MSNTRKPLQRAPSGLLLPTTVPLRPRVEAWTKYDGRTIVYEVSQVEGIGGVVMLDPLVFRHILLMLGFEPVPVDMDGSP